MQSGATASAIWERVADKSLAVAIALAVSAVGFWWHRKTMYKIFDFLFGTVIAKLESIERKLDDLKKDK